MSAGSALKRIYLVLSSQFGLDPRRTIRGIGGIPRYLSDLSRFRAAYKGPLMLHPELQNWKEGAGYTTSEYFWQDLIVARMICEAKPERHVDIGSRIDGFVAHLASFRDVEVFDIRPVADSIPGVTFRRADFMKPVPGLTGYCDSLSCLHALEHFGLGRYGDSVDAHGFESGFTNIARLLRPGGVLYLSTPIGMPRVEFNAHRVSDPATVMRLAAESSLVPRSLTVIRDGNRIETAAPDEATIARLKGEEYNLGIFTFLKR